MGLPRDERTKEIIGAAITVHKALGPGFLESVYENAQVIELRKHGLHVEQQVEVPVMYDGVEVGKHRLDLLIGHVVVLELKAVAGITDLHMRINRSYLKAASLRIGLILNFAKTALEIKSVFPKNMP